ncbi:MAG: ligase-associated DNA damage response DEXH box helicase [Lysobacteraceae bacterium]
MSPRAARAPEDPALARLQGWFAARGWQPQAFQHAVWSHWRDGRSGLLNAPTGSGKTLAVWGGALLDALDAPAPPGRRIRQLWVTPLRALAHDTAAQLAAPVQALGLDWRVVLRTGDASARDRRLARRGEADVLVTTPESLALLLSQPDATSLFGALRGAVVDEWHELIGGKRGVLLELCLARLRRCAPTLRLWGISATLGNLEEARDVLLPHAPEAPLVVGPARPVPQVLTLVPPPGERFPWAGHLGLRQLPRVLDQLRGARSSLVFTNTRAQAELWFQALASVWPLPSDTLAVHHGSLDAAARRAVEDGLRQGRLRCVVATSSLDLGVDFPAVDQVVQVGSPRGLARLLQRAGRSGHTPEGRSRLLCVPTHALELLDFAAARRALAEGAIESRPPLRAPLDVLAQHLVTLALGGGFRAEEAYAEVRSSHAYARLPRQRFNSVLAFLSTGGDALGHYPEFRRLQADAQGVWRMTDRRQAMRHRLSIGTILGDGSLDVRFLKGGRVGSVEEAFVARLRPGDRFVLGGRQLELVRLRDMTAWVRLARGGGGAVSRWAGSRMPLSAELGGAMLQVLQDPDPSAPEHAGLEPLLALQARVSALPGRDRLLVERVQRREGQLLFLYPFAGRAVHEGIAALLALRIARRAPNSLATAANDLGLMLLAEKPFDLDTATLRTLLAPSELHEDLHDGLNLGELARRQFREVARVAGLLPPSMPGRQTRSLRQLQASSGLLHDVLAEHDPGHLLLVQAREETMEQVLQAGRLEAVLNRFANGTITLREPATLTPFGFPLWAENLRDRISTEDWRTRVEREAARLEARHR